MPPQPHAANDPLPDSEVWRTLFQTSFIGPLATLKAAIFANAAQCGHRAAREDRDHFRDLSAQVLRHYATSNVIRTAWPGEAKTLAFALGERNIHINTLSLGGTLTPGYRDTSAQRAAAVGQSFDDRLKTETDNVPLRKYGQPSEVAVAVGGLLSSFCEHMTGVNRLHDGGFTPITFPAWAFRLNLQCNIIRMIRCVVLRLETSGGEPAKLVAVPVGPSNDRSGEQKRPIRVTFRGELAGRAATG